MVFGGLWTERLALNEEGIWEDAPRDRRNPRAKEALPKLRELLFAGQNVEAERLAEEAFLGVPPRFGSYQPLGDLYLTTTPADSGWHGYGDPAVQAGKSGAYRRELDLRTGVANTSFTGAGAELHRSVFASQLYQVIVMRLTSSLALSGSVRLVRTQDARSFTVGRDGLVLSGRVSGAFNDGDGVEFASYLRVVCDGDSLVPRGECLEFDQAGELTLYIAATSDGSFDRCKDELTGRVARAAEAGYGAVLERHMDEHRRVMDRVGIELGGDAPGAEESPLSTSELLSACGAGDPDATARLVEDYVQYMRYLLWASSRPGTLPSNLQGIWNERMHAPWCSDFHANINMQMNYWPADLWAVDESAKALFAWMSDLAERGRRTADRLYGCGGWVLHHVSNRFWNTEPIAGVLGIWPMGAAWLCRHLFEHWQYGRDRDFLRQVAYPRMKAAAEFILDFLIEAPEHSACPGKLVTNPSHSPENAFLLPDGTRSMFGYAATMDIAIIRDLFANCLAAAEELAAERAGEETAELSAFVDRLRRAQSRLPDFTISRRTGGIQEWIEDYEEVEPGHRHISHLFGAFPSHQITPDSTPELAEAVARSLERRLSHEYHGTGWSLGWIACLWARLGDGERAYAAIRELLRDYLFPNLMVNAHGNPQVGDMGGLATAVGEMIVQSHGGLIRLLPALPDAWSSGSVAGIRCRGGLELELAWTEKKPRRASLVARADAACTMCAAVPFSVLGPTQELIARSSAAGGLKNRVALELRAGSTYRLQFGETYEK
jgi:alpha-L-fucosidase 2